ncbi:hypothetical protein [Hymenobacter psychrophilus]|uniref:Uncharacterized protein n=1 Tax=Hymenobacter psychrophilus TaxID=651662 RepID=A0A1H3GRP5_9BACT|nr:hypothetical protein [Hymenobacter psychrophilus]SDY06006.1 hypothetical protein SAMN04488069_105147 [Hymenobacter psychrophilus]
MSHATRIDQTVRRIYDTFDNPGTSPVEAGLGDIDSWIDAIDGLGGSALTGLQTELRNLRSYVERDDRPAIAATLQRLGTETSRIAHGMHSLTDNTGDQLRHLGQTLVIAAGNLKMS